MKSGLTRILVTRNFTRMVTTVIFRRDSRGRGGGVLLAINLLRRYDLEVDAGKFVYQ